METGLAIGILGAKAPQVLEQTLRNWSAGPCRVYLHIDAKFDASCYKFARSFSNVRFVEPRTAVHWGGFSMVEAEFALLGAAARDGFEFFVLQSDDAVPLMAAPRMIETLREEERWVSLKPTDSPDIRSRYEHFYCLDTIGANPQNPNWHFDEVDLPKLEQLAGLRRSGKFPLEGLFWSSQWKALRRHDVDYLLRSYAGQGHLFDSFKFSAIADEHYVPTLLGRRPEGVQAIDRFIWADFNRHPRPYVFQAEDDLQPARDAGYLFARKVHDPVLAKLLIERNRAAPRFGS